MVLSVILTLDTDFPSQIDYKSDKLNQKDNPS